MLLDDAGAEALLKCKPGSCRLCDQSRHNPPCFKFDRVMSRDDEASSGKAVLKAKESKRTTRSSNKDNFFVIHQELASSGQRVGIQRANGEWVVEWNIGPSPQGELCMCACLLALSTCTCNN
jgi:hypothetical protein